MKNCLKISSVFKLLINASSGLLLLGVAHAESYVVDSGHTFPVFEVEHFTFSIQRGLFTKTAGTIEYDAASHKVSADITIDAASVEMGLDERNKVMRSDKFLNADKFPAIHFVIPEFQLSDVVKVNFIPGNLTLLGVTKPVTLAVQISCGKHPVLLHEICGANIEATIKRSDFGMNYGLPGIGDEINIITPVEAIKAVKASH